MAHKFSPADHPRAKNGTFRTKAGRGAAPGSFATGGAAAAARRKAARKRLARHGGVGHQF